MSPAERHLMQRLVAFFATGDSIVANNLVLNLYKHINAPEARMYLSRQLYEEALHVQFYLTLLDTYVARPRRALPRLRRRREHPVHRAGRPTSASVDRLHPASGPARLARRAPTVPAEPHLLRGLHRGPVLLRAFAYVYFLRSRGLLHGLAGGTNWVFRDESAHMAFAFEVVRQVRREEPELFDAALESDVRQMMDEAIACETAFAEDLLGGGVAGLSVRDMRQYLEFVADQRLVTLGLSRQYGARNPFPFMDLQDVQELTNFFERRVSAYQVGVTGEVVFDAAF